MFILKVYSGADEPVAHSFDPESDAYTIGRAPRSDRVLTDGRVSNDHCALVRAGQDWILYDGDPQASRWEMREPRISVGHVFKKTISMVPGMLVTLIDVKDYRVTLERERDQRRDTTGDGIDRSTIEDQKLTPGLLVSILDEFVENLKPIIQPLVESNALLIESSETLMARVTDVDNRLASESTERKDSDRSAGKDLHSLNKFVMYGAAVVLAATVFSLTRGDKEVTGKIIDLLIAAISSGLLIKTVSAK